MTRIQSSLTLVKHNLCFKFSATEETVIKPIRFNFLTFKKVICGTCLVPQVDTTFVYMKCSLFEWNHQLALCCCDDPIHPTLVAKLNKDKNNDRI